MGKAKDSKELKKEKSKRKLAETPKPVSVPPPGVSGKEKKREDNDDDSGAGVSGTSVETKNESKKKIVAIAKVKKASTGDPRRDMINKISSDLLKLCSQKNKIGQKLIRDEEVDKEHFPYIIAFLMEQVNKIRRIDVSIKQEIVAKTMGELIKERLNGNGMHDLLKFNEKATPELIKIAVEIADGKVKIKNFNKTKYFCFCF